MTTTKKKEEPTGLYTAGFVLGIIGVVFSIIPACYWIGLILGVLALIFGIIGLSRKVEGYKPVTATVLGAISLIISIIMMILWINIWNTAIDTMFDSDLWSSLIEYTSSAADSTTEEILNNYAKVEILGYEEEEDALSDGALRVKVTNIADSSNSYSFAFEAVDENGDRLDTDDAYVESLAPGQSTTIKTFKYSLLSTEDLKKAVFKIYKASMY